MEKHNDSTAQAVEQKALVKKDSINFAAIMDQSTNSASLKVAGAELTVSESATKSLPKLEIYDSGKEQNRDAIDEKEKPQHKGSGSWAALENYTLAVAKTDPLASGKEQNKDTVNKKEAPRSVGSGNWAALEGYSLGK